MKYFSFEISVFRYVFPLHNPVRSPAHAFLVLQSSSWVFCALAFPLTFCGAFQHVTLHCVFFFACPMHSLYKILCVPSCSTGEFLPVLPMYLLCSVIVLLPIISCVLKSQTLHPRPSFSYVSPCAPCKQASVFVDVFSLGSLLPTYLVQLLWVCIIPLVIH